jgi:hypothetical protein
MSGPYRLISTDDPCRTLGQGEVRNFATMIDATNAFAKTTEPCKTVIYDDGCTARELNDREQWLLEHVCKMLGYHVGEVAPGRGRQRVRRGRRRRPPHRGAHRWRRAPPPGQFDEHLPLPPFRLSTRSDTGEGGRWLLERLGVTTSGRTHLA